MRGGGAAQEQDADLTGRWPSNFAALSCDLEEGALCLCFYKGQHFKLLCFEFNRHCPQVSYKNCANLISGMWQRQALFSNMLITSGKKHSRPLQCLLLVTGEFRLKATVTFHEMSKKLLC